MNTESITIIIIVVLTFLLVIYDIYALVKGGEEATISVIIGKAAMKRPIVALVWGILMGHWFWPLGC